MQDGAAGDLRRFIRDLTAATGLLRGRLYDVDLSLTEARVLYEIATGEAATAEAIRARLTLDKGYLSRVVAKLEARGWIERRVSARDRRARVLALTEAGRALFERIDRRSTEEIEGVIAHLAPAARRQLSEALALAGRLLRPMDGGATIVLRQPRPGDLGHVVSRHGALYAAEHGFDATFEGAVGAIAGRFLQEADPARERCLIAEVDGAIAGSATVVRLDDATAQLRIVYVEPWARGLGLGERLVRACMDFAAGAGYARMRLWTNDVLAPARRLYERLGFRLIESEPHRSFGVDLVGEVWERGL
jgi:DNA-binding MarR family transcriptional regulator/GNAT superfamily N-acetyltransferase